MAKTLAGITAGIKAYFDAKTIAGIAKKLYHPDLKEVQGLPGGTLIFTWDKARYENLTLTGNDSIELTAIIDAIVAPGGGLAFIDSLVEAIKADITLGRAVLSTTIDEIDLNNPSGGFEGVSGRITFKK